MIKPNIVAEMIEKGETPITILQGIHLEEHPHADGAKISDEEKDKETRKQLALFIGHKLLEDELLEFDEERKWNPITRRHERKITARLTAIDPAKYNEYVEKEGGEE